MVQMEIVCEVMVSSGYETASLTDIATQELRMIARFYSAHTYIFNLILKGL